MAEIEFKRRGTPLWAVVLVLLVIAGALWALFGRGDNQPATAAADSTATAPGATPTTPQAGTPGAPPAPVAPVPALAAWVDTATVSSAPDQVAAYASQGLRLVAAALEEKLPMAGAQHVMIRAMADTVGMAGTPARKQLDATQAAFFGVVYALRQTPNAARIENAAARLELTRSLVEQRDDVKHFFEVARDVLRDPSVAPAGAVPKGPRA